MSLVHAHSLTSTELVILLLRNSREQNIKGRTRFQKIVFLLEEQGIDFGYEFKPYLYGPYSTELKSNLTMLADLGLLNEDKEEIESDGIVYDRYVYSLTEEGERVAERMERNAQEISRTLGELVNNIQDVSTGSLILSSKYIMNEKLSHQ